MTMYELKDEYRQLLDMVDDDDVSPDALKDTFEAIEGEIEAKAEGYAMVIAEAERDVLAIDAEIDRLEARMNCRKNKIKAMKEVVKDAMELTGKTKFQTALYNFSIRKNPYKVVIDNEQMIPAEFFRIPEPELSKADLKEALKKQLESEGTAPAYAHLEQGTSLSIR